MRNQEASGNKERDLSEVIFQVFHRRMPAEAMDLVSRLLQYSPTLRFTAVSGRSSFSVEMACLEIFHVIMKYCNMEIKTKYHSSKPFCNL